MLVCASGNRATMADAVVPGQTNPTLDLRNYRKAIFIREFLRDWSVVQGAMEWPQNKAISFSEARAKAAVL